MNPTNYSKEHRRFTRIPFAATATVVMGGNRITVDLIDISLKGVLVGTSTNWRPQTGQTALFELAPADSGVVIRMQAEVAHAENQHVGLRCLHIDVESITHLKRLVELNLGDADRLHRELHALIAEN
jgi:hypothetical protein